MIGNRICAIALAAASATIKVQLYGLAYRNAWGRISPHQKRDQPDLFSRLHASIRRELKEGETDPFLIASEALKTLDEEAKPGTRKTHES